MRCEKHGEYEERKANLCGRIISFGCPYCEQEQEQEQKIKAEKEKEQSIMHKLMRQNIEPIFFNSTLENYICDTDEQKKAKEAIEKLIEERKGKIIMLGKNGTGKTHLAVCAVKVIGGRIYTMYEIATRIRASYTARAKEDELEIVDELARLPLLVIDEIGRTKGSDAEENWLSYIIDKRNSRGLPLIIISNKHTKKTCKEGGCKDCVENYLSEDVLSRLCVDGKVLYFTGEDFRKKR
jgi:DNA replication protein DnaC